MAHKELIGGTAYDTKSGKCLIDGTGYAIKKGRTLVGGTGYDVGWPKYTLTFTYYSSTTGSGMAYVRVNGVAYSSGNPVSSVQVSAGDVLTAYAGSDENSSSAPTISVFGTVVAKGTVKLGSASYSMAVTQNLNISVVISGTASKGTLYGRITITAA